MQRKLSYLILALAISLFICPPSKADTASLLTTLDAQQDLTTQASHSTKLAGNPYGQVTSNNSKMNTQAGASMHHHGVANPSSLALLGFVLIAIAIPRNKRRGKLFSFSGVIKTNSPR